MVAKTKNAKMLFAFIFCVAMLYVGFQLTARHNFFFGGPFHDYAKFEAEKTRYIYEDERIGNRTSRKIVGSYVAGPGVFVQNAWYGGAVALVSLVLFKLLASGDSDRLNEVFADVDADRDPGDHDW